jgi:hypothetical protein
MVMERTPETEAKIDALEAVMNERHTNEDSQIRKSFVVAAAIFFGGAVVGTMALKELAGVELAPAGVASSYASAAAAATYGLYQTLKVIRGSRKAYALEQRQLTEILSCH